MKKNTIIFLTIVATLVLFASCKNPTNSQKDIFYNVGDLVLSNGTKIAYDENRTDFSDFDFSKVKPVAIIYKEGKKGNAFCVGIKHGIHLAWCTTDLHKIEITDIICTAKKDDNNDYTGVWNSSVTMEGDTDGSDNWNQIVSFFENPEQAENKEAGQNIENYAAFKYAQNYGTEGDSNLSDTNYKTNWYLPSIAELVEIYMNIDKIMQVLEDLSEQDSHKFKATYWSSSQKSNWPEAAYGVDFNNDKIGMYTKNNSSSINVCVVRKF